MNHMYTRIYNVPLFDDIHNYLPDLLYNNGRFRTVSDVFAYINQMMRYNFDRYSTAAAAAQPAPVPVPARVTVVPTTLDFLTQLLDLYTPATQSTPTVDNLRRETTVTAFQLLGRPADNVCPICHDNIAPTATVRTIRHCNHTFHIGCIDEWFRRSACCPVCRHDVRQGYDADDEGNDSE
jgi:hypothetical protein